MGNKKWGAWVREHPYVYKQLKDPTNLDSFKSRPKSMFQAYLFIYFNYYCFVELPVI